MVGAIESTPGNILDSARDLTNLPGAILGGGKKKEPAGDKPPTSNPVDALKGLFGR